MKLSNKVYNFLKWVTTIWLPSAGALYYGITEVADIQRTFQVNATINGIIAALGGLLAVSSRQYKKLHYGNEDVVDGDLIVTEVDGEKYLGLGVNDSIESMQRKNVVRLNVVDKSMDSQA